MKDFPPFWVYQVELSSHCNMRCSYCPHPGMRRRRGYMEENVLAACIDRIKKMGGSMIVLHHFGEPLLHPHLEERLRQIADSGLTIRFSTNALLLDSAWKLLIRLGCKCEVMIAAHQWSMIGIESYEQALATYQERSAGTNVSVLRAYNIKPGRFSFHRWGNGTKTEWNEAGCPFIEQNLAVILWNGDIASCCVDHEGVTAKENILSVDAESHVSRSWKACSTCDVGRLMVGENWRKL